jgi:hypothetical protein
VPRLGEPGGLGSEGVDAHARMGGGDDLEERRSAAGEHAGDIALRSGLKCGRRGSGRVGGGAGLRHVDGEEELEIDWLLGPERAIVVEDSYPLGLGHVIRSGGIGNRRDETDDRRLRFPVAT